MTSSYETSGEREDSAGQKRSFDRINPYTRRAYLAAQAAAKQQQSRQRFLAGFLPHPFTVLAVLVALVVTAVIIGLTGMIGSGWGGSLAGAAGGSFSGAEAPAFADSKESGADSAGGRGSANAEARAGSGAAGKDGAKSRVYVHVVGQVKNPGLIELPVGARVAQAIKAAGGTVDPVDLRQINLARILEDGEQLVIYKPGEGPSGVGGGDESNSSGSSPGDASSATSGATGGSGATVGAGASGRKISINSAGQSDLEQLNGVGAALAKRILEYRKTHGRFNRLEDLKQVPGIGAKKYDGLKDQIRL